MCIARVVQPSWTSGPPEDLSHATEAGSCPELIAQQILVGEPGLASPPARRDVGDPLFFPHKPSIGELSSKRHHASASSLTCTSTMDQSSMSSSARPQKQRRRSWDVDAICRALSKTDFEAKSGLPSHPYHWRDCARRAAATSSNDQCGRRRTPCSSLERLGRTRPTGIDRGHGTTFRIPNHICTRRATRHRRMSRGITPL